MKQTILDTISDLCSDLKNKHVDSFGKFNENKFNCFFKTTSLSNIQGQFLHDITYSDNYSFL